MKRPAARVAVVAAKRVRGDATSRALVLALLFFVALGAFGNELARASSLKPAYVGGSACAACHAREQAAWQGSQHERAMQPATEKSVLGDFDNAKFKRASVTSTFFRRDGKFFVSTDGPDGKVADFEITHTFGVEPLQQYLVSFPDGRKQALGIAWDTRPKGAGGQRWFDLYPGEKIVAGERLHWTGIDQNWNYQCADCHSTNLRKNFDAKTNTFRTTWTDISVSCEACHGPGSSHVEWAKKTGNWKGLDATKGLTVALDERRGVTWSPVAATGNSTRSRARGSSREIDVCARCHSRRGQFSDDHVAGEPFTNAFRPALLDPGLYHVDGQMRDEVYNYGSFLQSRMNAHGVTCSDCHEPHGGKLRPQGNAVCAQCHSPEKFSAPGHHHHATGSKGAECAACHMPTVTYMVIDPRHDHSIRIPRPDLSAKLGTPNACNACHKDRNPAWAIGAIAKWFPKRESEFQDFAVAFAGADRGDSDALAKVAGIANDSAEPAIVRASAIARLGRNPRPSGFPALRQALDDPDPVVRTAAVAALEQLDSGARAGLLARMVNDPSRLVRMEAASALAGTSINSPEATRAREEFVAAQRFNADRPEANTALGNFYAASGDSDGAAAAYRKALEIDPAYVQASVNLADFQRSRGDEKGSEETLRGALRRDPSAAAAHHALGLSLVRQKRLPEAIPELSRAASLAPAQARFAYVYAVALADSGRGPEALKVIDAGLAQSPNDRDLLFAAVSFRADSGDTAGALRYARRLQAADPANVQVAKLVEKLEQRTR